MTKVWSSYGGGVRLSRLPILLINVLEFKYSTSNPTLIKPRAGGYVIVCELQQGYGD
jgi:hypothetical protein